MASSDAKSIIENRWNILNIIVPIAFQVILQIWSSQPSELEIQQTESLTTIATESVRSNDLKERELELKEYEIQVFEQLIDNATDEISEIRSMFYELYPHTE